MPGHERKPWTGAGRKMPSNWSSTIVPRILRRDPVCTEPGCNQPSTEVDHIGDRNDHRDENLRGLCGPHHRKKTQRQAAAARWPGRR